MSKPHRLVSYAKLNLVLKIFATSPGQLHPLSSVFQTISLHDTLDITPLPNKDIAITTNHPALVRTEDNLIYKIYQDFREHVPCGFHIALDKQIPIGGGLGGGSSNAACFLRYLNTLYLGYDPETLTKIGLRYGSDVPFFLHGGTALVEGVGERIAPWTPPYKGQVVLMNPNIHISTPSVFKAFDAAGLGKPVSDIAHTWHESLPIGENDLASVVFAHYPVYQDLIDYITLLGHQACLSGSGATVFIPVSPADTQRVYTLVKERFPDWWCATATAIPGGYA